MAYMILSMQYVFFFFKLQVTVFYQQLVSIH